MIELRPGQRRVLIPGLGVTVSRWAVSAVKPWYLANGTIAVEDVLEWVEYPAQGQLYAGASTEGESPWSIAVQSIYPGGNNFVFDAQTGRIVIGSDGTNNGYYINGWKNISLFPDSTTQYVYFLVHNGASQQAYRDNEAVGDASTFDSIIGGVVRWRSNNANNASFWTNDVPRAAVYNIALDATQRTALYASMNAL